ncbi:MAG: hypothetical protein K2P84_09705 [Undibacterium sp.]|nr:hypothetical protein [Undibacterium sp.]
MKISIAQFRQSMACYILCASCVFTSCAKAVDVSEFRAQDVLAILSVYKTSANLSANQQALWQQTETKSKTLLRIREARHHELQENIKKRLQENNPEWRDIAKMMDQDDLASTQENQQLRAYWMDIYDALNDHQREALTVLMRDQLARVEDKPKEARTSADKPNNGGGHRNGKGERRGGA